MTERDGTYRGFLFADLRGYSADVERHGDRAASTLLDAYRALIRAQVAEHAGAEIKTEGDSFYVVFPSAHRAVRCALAILAAATRHNEAGDGLPIRVGIGVHAGEVVEGSEGYVGSAVNVAARICALARPGELLVSRTVRDLTRTGLMLEIEPRGTHRLKGIGEPVAVFAVHDRAARPARRRLPWASAGARARTIGLALVVGVLAFAVAILFGDQLMGLGTAGSLDSSAPATTAALPSASAVAASPTTDPNVFPNEAEAALRARFDDHLVSACRRADPADAPRMYRYPQFFDRDNPLIYPIAIHAGLRCPLALASEPDLVEIWSGVQEANISEAIGSQAGQAGALPGDCADDDNQYGRWEFGQTTGRVLCVVTDNDARMTWTYDDEFIIAVAIREDGDGRALYTWWRENARSLRPAAED